MSKTDKVEDKKAAPEATKEVPKTNAEGAAEAPKKEKHLIPDIIRGRMPIAVVAMVRFGDQKNGETKALADLFGTTVGKITDIKKKSTFAYLPENFKPTQAQKDEGIAWLQKHVGFKDGKVDGLIGELEATKVATAEEAASYEAIRIAHRGQLPTKKDGAAANAGGGNRQAAKKAPAAAAPAGAKPSAKDLI